MTIRRKSAGLILLLLVLTIASGFFLLALRGREEGAGIDMVALFFGVVIPFFIVVQYNVIRYAFRHIDRIVLLAADFLWAFGVLVIYRMNPDLALKQMICVLIGNVAMVVVMILVRRSRDFGKLNWLFMGMTLLLLISAIVLGRTIGGAKNWINIGGFSFQPSEIAKVLFIMVSAFFLSTRDKLRSFIPYMIFTAACVIIQVVAKDLGSALLIAITFLLMFYSATGRVWLTLGGVGVLGAGAVGSYFLFSHVRTRVEVWLDPWASYQTDGYQIVQGLMALASGGLTGVGLGLGSPESIPAGHTDYIFTVIGEEFGIIVGIFIICFYLIFVIRGMLIAMNTRSTYDALMVFGCTAMLAVQCFIIIGGVIKLIPLTGITLPFVSYGGSSMIASMIQLGIIEGIALKNGRREDEALKMMGGGIK